MIADEIENSYGTHRDFRRVAHEIGLVPATGSPLDVVCRPLITDGLLCTKGGNKPVILIDSDLSREEKLLTLWHEVVHLLRFAGGHDQDEDDVEQWAKRLAEVCPEALEWVGLGKANDKAEPRR